MSSVKLNPLQDKPVLDPPEKRRLLEQIQQWGKELGFSQIGVASVDLTHAEQGLINWLSEGFHGEMQYMQTHGLKRARPAELVPGTLSVITARMNYLPRNTSTVDGYWLTQELSRLERKDEGVVSVYARGRDYHKVMRQRLDRLAQKIQESVGRLGYRVFTDSAPVLEVELGVQSGLGWRGKHTLLLNRDSGSMFFLGEIYINLLLEPTPKQEAHCGTCNACLDVCPTGAITKPYVVDARKCISYLTIEHQGSIPLELRRKIGNHIYGCDDCQTVCPWNKYAQPTELEDFDVRDELIFGVKNFPKSDQLINRGGKLVDYFSWTEDEFDLNTRGTAIRRIGHERWLRNIAVAMGNALASYYSQNLSQSNIKNHLPLSNVEIGEIEQALHGRLNHSSSLVVEHVKWALSQKDSVSQPAQTPLPI